MAARSDRPVVPQARSVDDLDYDPDALEEIELASDLMIAANSTDALEDGALDRALGLRSCDG